MTNTTLFRTIVAQTLKKTVFGPSQVTFYTLLRYQGSVATKLSIFDLSLDVRVTTINSVSIVELDIFFISRHAQQTGSYFDGYIMGGGTSTY